ncbi:ead/Ea22-like family protein [Citrobacter koseri]|uniref:ead/Ea22-like family protein n=1 Tax=Citrobacter koseri TaxID=545 RepID=UPI003524D1F9
MSNIDKQALREAAEKYRTTYAAHLKNPRNYDALDAWDKATSEFMALVNNDELNIIASLIDEIDMETGYREGAFVACNRWHTKFRETEAKLEAAEKRIVELREWNAGLAQESLTHQQRIAELSGQKRLIGWRASDYTDETSDPELAKNWAAAIGVLPIFEGDVNTKLSAAGIGKGE